MACNIYGDFLVKGKTVDGEWVEWNAMLCGARDSTSDHIIVVEIARPLKTDMPSVEMRTYSIEKDTICRFSYLSDSFGRKLYEGDIVLVDGYTFVIAFGICDKYCSRYTNDRSWSIDRKRGGYHAFYFEAVGEHMEKFLHYGLRDDPIHFMKHCKFCKRIGNIHDQYTRDEEDKGRQLSINAALNSIKGESE